HAAALGLDAGLSGLVGRKDILEKLGVVGKGLVAGQLGQVLAGSLGELIHSQAHAETELGVVLEQRVGPGRAAAIGTLGPGGGGKVAAVNGGTAGGVGDHHPVAEQTGEEPQVGCLAAASAGAGELEQRTDQLVAAQGVQFDLGGVHIGQREEEVPV